ncbi:type II secretion system minor pseudopilin GspJ [Pseudomonas sp. NPDC088368]|jgi:general secretion pathway protein J|uniref:type II secretion system minor pseudopilin GspJ n=1 Tax=Pseudomonas sp. NPDC088368 TaxID=3364453 RepID=UPI0037F8524F
MMTNRGFTLLEVLVSLAIFSTLGFASWRLFDGVFRVQEQVRQEQRDVRDLRRAVAIIERDLMQATFSPKTPSVQLRHGVLNLRRGNWRNPLGQPRGEGQEVSYVLEDNQLLRYSRSLDLPDVQKQVLLREVRGVGWRLYDARHAWRAEWPQGAQVGQPKAVELTLSFARFEGIRRVIPLAGDA